MVLLSSVIYTTFKLDKVGYMINTSPHGHMQEDITLPNGVVLNQHIFFINDELYSAISKFYLDDILIIQITTGRMMVIRVLRFQQQNISYNILTNYQSMLSWPTTYGTPYHVLMILRV